MTIPKFLAGVIFTILAELAALIIYAIIKNRRNKR